MHVSPLKEVRDASAAVYQQLEEFHILLLSVTFMFYLILFFLFTAVIKITGQNQGIDLALYNCSKVKLFTIGG